jgi:hypothetical protein
MDRHVSGEAVEKEHEMSLIIPPYDLAQLTTWLKSFISLSDIRARVLLTAPAGMRYKQVVYTLGLQDLNAGMAAATVVGWRYLALVNGLAVAADVIQPVGKAAPKIASISAGPQIHQAIDAIPLILRLPDVQRTNYELATLRLPGVLTEAYWLRFINGEEHQFVPYLSLNKQLPLRVPYKWSDFLQKFQDLAQTNLKFFATDMMDGIQ